MAQDAAELVVAKEVLTRLQPLSFEKRREYCGYIGIILPRLNCPKFSVIR